MATISDRYSEDASFELLLTRLSVGNNEIARIQSDGFTKMELLVKHFAYDVKGFKEHLLSLNKSLRPQREQEGFISTLSSRIAY